MTREARCGRTDPHGAHVIDRGESGDIHSWCAGNINTVEAIPACSVMGRDWAGRLQSCIKIAPHTGRHVGATGGSLKAEGPSEADIRYLDNLLRESDEAER